MQHILRVLNSEFKRREKHAKEFYKKYCDLQDEIDELRTENKALRDELFQLSLNHFKNKSNAEKENDCE
jgi:hypothetical protein